MEPTWLQNGSLEASGRRPSPEAFGEALGRLLGPSGRLLGRSCELLGRSWGSFWFPRGVFLELFGCPGGHLRELFDIGAYSGKKLTKILFFSICWKVFGAAVLVDFFALLAAPARERTLQKQAFAWRVQKQRR